jgi:hypothetical protein
MSGAGVTNKNSLLLDVVMSLTVRRACVYRVSMIEAPTNGVPFNHLIAHDIQDLDSRDGREKDD